MRKALLIFLILVCGLTSNGQDHYTIRYPNVIPLNGTWLFTLDPTKSGEKEQWFRDTYPEKQWDQVEVPNCFSVDPRYANYTGTVWYRRKFALKAPAGKRVILHFDAAYYFCTAWVNNKKAGMHEGGYTPFEMEITDFLKDGDNYLSIQVSNDTWKRGTIPGAKDEYSESSMPHNQFPGWLNYGGLTRPVYLTIEPETYIQNIKVEATPDLINKKASVHARIFIKTISPVAPAVPLIGLFFNGKRITLPWKFKPIAAPSGGVCVVEADAVIGSTNYKLWNLDEPALYTLMVMGADTLSTRFGIRQVEIRNAQFLLNGEPVRMAGANRVIDYPGYGSLEPDWLVKKDLRLMKEGGMEFQRLTHYTTTEGVLEWADENGMLIIAEAGNWQLTPHQMSNDTIQTKFKKQFTEMAERDWNHPSIIAYSVGNEYQSMTPSGQRWTKDMIVFAKQTDPTRLCTFASMMINALPKNPEDEASQYCDFICANIYGNHAKVLDNLHRLYPEKPILLSEHGTRADGKNGEQEQLDYLKKFMVEIRQRPYVIGASWWTFNDYQSRFPGTNKDGYRGWGLVRADRSLRPAYAMHQTEMSPVVVRKSKIMPDEQGGNKLVVTVKSRSDFPAYTVRRYQLKAGNFSTILPDLAPGQSIDVVIPLRGFAAALNVEVITPTGFTILNETIDLN